MAVEAYTSRPQTGEGAGAVRPMLCGSDDTECNRLCSARRSDLAPCDGAAGFDDRELFELLLEPRHRSPLYRSSLLRMTLMLLEQHGLPTPESGKSSSKRRPWD